MRASRYRVPPSLVKKTVHNIFGRTTKLCDVLLKDVLIDILFLFGVIFLKVCFGKICFEGFMVL
uniref:Putative ovule protein n=1 Tax=Solanum chacoense TaxID=4108 RepID=A0A0V0H9Q5_SOLCH